MYQEKGITLMLLFAIFSAVLGMFQFGYNTGVINAPQKVLEEWIFNVYKGRTGKWISEELRDVLWSIIVSVFAIGGMLGGILAPSLANWCGRKTGLVLNNTVAVLGVTLMSSSQLFQSIECLIFGRFFIGLNCGLNTALVPMYLSEIATVNIRGALGTVSQLAVTIGLLFSQVLGLKEILGTKDHWPFLFGFAFVPAVLQLIMLPFCPESPRYLLLNCSRISEARTALRRLRSTNDIEQDIEEMRAEEEAHQEEIRKYGKLSSVRELFNHPWLRTPLIIGIMMQLSQQLSGINAILYYSTDIFLSAEVPENYAVYATLGVGATMVITTLISIPMMDRLGRRTLHLYGLAGMFLASIFLTISLLVKFLYDWMKYISVISILFYTLFFGIGPGSIPFLITAELFTQGTRPAAMSVSVFANWFSNFAVGLTFPLMKRLLQSYLFLPYTVFLAIFWIFTYNKLPETKNRTFEEIASLFRPIKLNPGSPGILANYGCTSMGAVSDTDASGNLLIVQTPASGSHNQIDGQRFNFEDSKLDNKQQLHQSCCNVNQMSSQGNIETVAHNSSISIAQNLSTSDQQPLIVQDAQLDDSRAWCSRRFTQTQQGARPLTIDQDDNSDSYRRHSGNTQPHMHSYHHSHDRSDSTSSHANLPGLRTTSFMGLKRAPDCTCSAALETEVKQQQHGKRNNLKSRHSLATFVCDHDHDHVHHKHEHEHGDQQQRYHNELFGSTRRNWIINRNYDDDDDEDDNDDYRKRSRTLTRAIIYKPLVNEVTGVTTNNKRFSTFASTNDLNLSDTRQADFNIKSLLRKRRLSTYMPISYQRSIPTPSDSLQREQTRTTR